MVFSLWLQFYLNDAVNRILLFVFPIPIDSRTDRASATLTVDSGLIPGWIKPETIKTGIHSFLA